MIATNSLVHQNEGAQGEEEARGRRKGEPTGTPKPGADAPTGLPQSGVSDAKNRRRHGWWCGVPIHRRGIRDQSLPLKIGMNGNNSKKTKVVKGYFCRA